MNNPEQPGTSELVALWNQRAKEERLNRQDFKKIKMESFASENVETIPTSANGSVTSSATPNRVKLSAVADVTKELNSSKPPRSITFNQLTQEVEDSEYKNPVTNSKIIEENLILGSKLLLQSIGGPGKTLAASHYINSVSEAIMRRANEIGSDESKPSFWINGLLPKIKAKCIGRKNQYDPELAIRCLSQSMDYCSYTVPLLKYNLVDTQSSIIPLNTFIDDLRICILEVKTGDKNQERKAIEPSEPAPIIPSIQQPCSNHTKDKSDIKPVNEKFEDKCDELHQMIKGHDANNSENPLSFADIIAHNDGNGLNGVANIFKLCHLAKEGAVQIEQIPNQMPLSSLVVKSVENDTGINGLEKRERKIKRRNQGIVTISAKQMKEIQRRHALTEDSN